MSMLGKNLEFGVLHRYYISGKITPLMKDAVTDGSCSNADSSLLCHTDKGVEYDTTKC